MSVLSLLRSLARPSRDAVEAAANPDRVLLVDSRPALVLIPFTDVVWDPRARN